MKGCFVCGKDHRANEKHEREEVSAGIKRLKEEHITAMLTVADLDVLYEVGTNGGNEDGQFEVQ